MWDWYNVGFLCGLDFRAGFMLRLRLVLVGYDCFVFVMEGYILGV